MTSTDPKKVQRLKAAYQSMTDDQFKEIDRRIRKVASECNLVLQEGADYALDIALQEFYNLRLIGATEDEIEAVLKYHNRGVLEYDVYGTLRDVWTRHRKPEGKQKRIASLEVRKEKSR